MKRKMLYMFVFSAIMHLSVFAFADRLAGREEEEKVVSCLKVDTAAIYVRMDTLNSQQIRTILVDNSNGDQAVSYKMSIRFVRSISDWEGLSAQDGIDEPPPPEEPDEGDNMEEGEGEKEPEEEPEIRVLQYHGEEMLSYAFGLPENALPQTYATKFTADTAGFTVSSVGVWFTGDCLSEGEIRVEIRAGGSSIDDAVPLAKGSLSFSIPEEEVNGQMYSIPLFRPASIYPGEDFYVIITYPAGQTRPQGSVLNQAVATVSGRYLIKTGNTWEDLQTREGYSHCGWLMNVTETAHENIKWLDLLSKPSDTIPARDTVGLSLLFTALPNIKGLRKAEVTISAGDNCKTVEIVPVTLHINEAPFFLNAPRSVYIPENTVRQFVIDLFDNEGNSFTLEPLAGAKVVSFRLSGSRLTLTVAPLSGDAGIYHVIFQLTDSHGESRKLNLPVYVTVLETLFKSEGLIFSFMGESVTCRIFDLFNYVNGGDFTFVATVRDDKVIKLERTGVHTIVITPNEPGSTYIDFSFVDSDGNAFTCPIPVTVGQCEDASRVIVQKWNNVLLVNNVFGKYSNDGYQWYKNGQEIPGAMGQYYLAGNNADETLDFNAYYYVRLITLAGDTAYSCPIAPVRKSLLMAKAYPNPVLAGEWLQVETGFDTNDDEEVQVQIFDITGRIVQTSVFRGKAGNIQIAPISSGYYFLNLSVKKEKKTFGIFIQ